MSNVETGGAEMRCQRILRILVLPCTDELGQPVEHIEIKAQDFSNFARGRLAAIGDHIRRHRSAEPAVTFVNILNGPFALIAAGKIKIDVGPLAAFFGEESFKQKL